MNKHKSMWRLFIVPIAVLFLAGGAILGVSQPAAVTAAPAQAAVMSAGCAALNNPAFDTTSPGGSLPATELWAGEQILISADDGPDSYLIALYINAVGVVTEGVPPFPGTIDYTVPADITAPIVWNFYGGDPNPNPIWNVQCVPKTSCGVALTPWAVVGRFTADAPLYWAPGEMAEPRVTIPAGKTAWVLGMDASGDYYKIVWACQTLWVPVGTMGPNTGDPIWNGAPLPTDVVE